MIFGFFWLVWVAGGRVVYSGGKSVECGLIAISAYSDIGMRHAMFTFGISQYPDIVGFKEI